jgi:hypothetical protein
MLEYPRKLQLCASCQLTRGQWLRTIASFESATFVIGLLLGCVLTLSAHLYVAAPGPGFGHGQVLYFDTHKALREIDGPTQVLILGSYRVSQCCSGSLMILSSPSISYCTCLDKPWRRPRAAHSNKLS